MDPTQGGLCQAVRNMIPALEAQGSFSEVVCLDAPNSIFLGGDLFPVHAVGPARGPYAYSAGLIPWLLANFKRFNVIVIHGLWQHSSTGTARALKYFRKSNLNEKIPRYYIMPHGMLDPYFQKASGRKLKAIRNTIFWKFFQGHVINDADGVLFTCAQELLLAREPFRPYRPKQEINVGMGVELPPAFHPNMTSAFIAKCPEVEKRPYLLFLSRLHEKKGADILIRAYLRLCASRPKRSLPVLVMAGPGLETDYGRKLKQLAMSPSADMDKGESDILFPGMLSGNAKWGALYGCQAFVLPSHQENFGIAVVEAMACGRPVLITRQINIWCECEPGGIVNEDTEAGIFELLTQWLGLTLDQQKALGNAAERAYLKNFEVLRAARRMNEALQGKTLQQPKTLLTSSRA